MKKTKKTASPAPSAPALSKALRITSAAQLQELVRKPVILPFGVASQAIELELFPLTPGQNELVENVLLELGTPPYRVIKGENGKVVVRNNEPLQDYDYNDVDFQKKRQQLLKEQRSLRIYLGCPAISADRPGLSNRAEIHAYVYGLFTENILELIHLNLQSGGLEMAERQNFITGAGSES